MENPTTDRARFACQGLVYLAIAFGALSFWSDAIAGGGPIDYLVALLLTAAFTFISFLLSSVVMRYAEARAAGQVVTNRLAIAMGLVLILLEGGMSHQGLAWLDARKDLGPDAVLWVASFGLSAFNVFGFYVFAREIPKAAAETPKASSSADLLVFGERSAAILGQAPRLDLRGSDSLREVASRLKAGGAL